MRKKHSLIPSLTSSKTSQLYSSASDSYCFLGGYSYQNSNANFPKIEQFQIFMIKKPGVYLEKEQYPQ